MAVPAQDPLAASGDADLARERGTRRLGRGPPRHRPRRGGRDAVQRHRGLRAGHPPPHRRCADPARAGLLGPGGDAAARADRDRHGAGRRPPGRRRRGAAHDLHGRARHRRRAAGDRPRAFGAARRRARRRRRPRRRHASSQKVQHLRADRLGELVEEPVPAAGRDAHPRARDPVAEQAAFSTGAIRSSLPCRTSVGTAIRGNPSHASWPGADPQVPARGVRGQRRVAEQVGRHPTTRACTSAPAARPAAWRDPAPRAGAARPARARSRAPRRASCTRGPARARARGG